MPRRAQTRTLAKWLGTVLTALLLIAWIGSTRYSASHSWNVRADPTPAAARPKESAPFSDLTNFDWVFRVNSDRYLPTQFRHQVGFATGRVYFYHDDDNGRGWWEPDDPRWSMRPGFDARIAPERRGFRPAFFALPLWFPVALIGIPTAMLWRADLRARRLARIHMCSRCGYDLATLAPTSPCPECGGGSFPSPAALSRARHRRNVTRLGAVLSILLFIVWIGSGYFPFSHKWNLRQATINQSPSAGNSTMYFRVPSGPSEYWDEFGVGIGRVWVALDMSVWTWSYGPSNGRLDLSLHYQIRSPAGSRQVFIFLPLWIPLVLVAIPTALLWRSGRNERQAISLA